MKKRTKLLISLMCVLAVSITSVGCGNEKANNATADSSKTDKIETSEVETSEVETSEVETSEVETSEVETSEAETSEAEADEIEAEKDYQNDECAEYLVACWDFAGEGENVFADKAPGGDYKDNLTIVNENRVKIAGGYANITGNGALKAEDSDDLDVTGPMTLFARVRITGESNGDIGEATTYLFSKQADEGKKTPYQIWTWWNGANYALAHESNDDEGNRLFNYKDGLVQGEFREVALVIDKDDAGKLTYEMFVSKSAATKSGDDYESFIPKGTWDYEKIVESDEPLYIGNAPSLPAYISTRVFDELRIYNVALTTDQLAGLLSE